jgi:uncharacterized membrane protein
MYIFVRIAAVMLIILGVIAMLAGLGGAIYSLIQNDAVTSSANKLMFGQPYRFVNLGMVGALAGLFTFFQGIMLAAIGQLMLVLVDMSNHAKETNLILRSFRRTTEE